MEEGATHSLAWCQTLLIRVCLSLQLPAVEEGATATPAWFPRAC